MPDPSSKALVLQHFGDHHQAHLLLKPGERSNERKLTGGAIVNFSDHAALNVHIDSSSRASALLGHSGDTHSLQINADTDGNFGGVFEDAEAGISLKLQGNIVELSQGQIPAAGLVIEGDHHQTILKLDADGKLSGSLKSRNTEGASFSLEFEGSQLKAGSFIHQGDRHTSQITLAQDGWSAALTADRHQQGWSVKVSGGKAGLATYGNLHLVRSL
ncbi:MAG: hypothetical protein AAGF24_14955 [Cyanobacteria bacterium P01_H01_bin.121]